MQERGQPIPRFAELSAELKLQIKNLTTENKRLALLASENKALIKQNAKLEGKNQQLRTKNSDLNKQVRALKKTKSYCLDKPAHEHRLEAAISKQTTPTAPQPAADIVAEVKRLQRHSEMEQWLRATVDEHKQQNRVLQEEIKVKDGIIKRLGQEKERADKKEGEATAHAAAWQDKCAKLYAESNSKLSAASAQIRMFLQQRVMSASLVASPAAEAVSSPFSVTMPTL